MKSSPVFVLYLQDDVIWLYQQQAHGLFATQETPLTDPKELEFWLQENPQAVWVLLADQVEEAFWNEKMPLLFGNARRVWAKRLLENTPLTSPFMAYQIQEKLPQDRRQRQVLCVALGEHQRITPWLDFLHKKQAKIRGLYTPALLAPAALHYLQVPNPNDGITILITPHPNGMRQCVMHNGHLIFSRVAFHDSHHPVNDLSPHGLSPEESLPLHRMDTPSQAEQRILREIAYLRNRLIQANLLLSEKSTLHIVLAGLADISNQMLEALRLKQTEAPEIMADRFTVVPPEDPRLFLMASTRLTDSTHGICGLFLNLLVLWQPRLQLAPDNYRYWDQQATATRALQKIKYIIYGVIGLTLLWTSIQIFNNYTKQKLLQNTLSTIRQQYAQIAHQFAFLPMTAANIDQTIRAINAVAEKPRLNVHDLLSIWGQTLANHPQVHVEVLEWDELPAQEALQIDKTPAWLAALPSQTPIFHLRIQGDIRESDQDNLRRARDSFFHFVEDIRSKLIEETVIQVDQAPFNLSAEQAITGNVGELQQNSSRFQLTAWQHPK
jgi:hypothetical protein